MSEYSAPRPSAYVSRFSVTMLIHVALPDRDDLDDVFGVRGELVPLLKSGAIRI